MGGGGGPQILYLENTFLKLILFKIILYFCIIIFYPIDIRLLIYVEIIKERALENVAYLKLESMIG